MGRRGNDWLHTCQSLRRLVILDKYYRVTSILSPYSDYDHIPRETLEKASDRGTRVHDYCSAYALGATVIGIDDDCKPYFNSFKEWFDMLDVEVFFSEKRFFSKKAMLTGKIDLVCRVEGVSDCVVIDIKTPQSQLVSWKLQTAAYQWLLKDNGHTVVHRGCLMLSNKGRTAKFARYDDFEEAWGIYKGLLEAYTYFDAVGQNKFSRKEERWT